MDHFHFKTHRDTMLKYYTFGDKDRVIVMLHAQGVSSDSYFAVAKVLAKKAKVILIDYYGHGGSSHDSELYKLDVIGDDVCELIRAVTDKQVTLVGHSSGGLIAAYVAANSQLCEKLILEDPPFFASWDEGRTKTFNYIDLSSVCHAFLQQRDEDDFVAYYFENQYAWNFFPEESRAKIKEKLCANARNFRAKHPEKDLKVMFWPKSALESFRGMQNYDPAFGETFYSNSFHSHIDYDALLKKIRCETVFLKAKTEIGSDGIEMCALTEEDLQRVVAGIGHCEVVRFDCGHGIHLEKKKDFLAVFR